MRLGLIIAALLLVSPLAVDAQTRPADEQAFLDVYRELVEINTTDSVGDNTKAAEAMAARLRAAGFPAADVQVLAPHPRKGNLVARLRGSGTGKPLLLLAHLDVVEARREDWSFDPFTLLEKDGYFYGRGSSDATRLYFERTAALHTGRVADDMRAVALPTPDPAALARLSADTVYSALLRTTCVATRLEGGHANNALPQMARAVVNCRILPDHPAEDVQRTLVRVVGAAPITVTPIGEPFNSPPSPLDPDLLARVERITSDMWPGTIVIPTMGTGATDSRWLRAVGFPSYGVSGLFLGESRAHGRDERMGVKDLYAGRQFLHRLIRELAAAQ